ncbi:DUF4168 domain-containing protein [Nodosilinea sp. E11]|uniref:DUF4168 domain-containing protein n=1 Tax=Nodosilinea sp. E11 TaxID=3037479 RepID=UPI002934B5DB|nr:DUF4168 domain-containing protein [Nodosilinea sp. E11]WOD38610.1 DUF4168 domain-containing protein [Nodosilinea sp. E11]
MTPPLVLLKQGASRFSGWSRWRDCLLGLVLAAVLHLAWPGCAIAAPTAPLLDDLPPTVSPTQPDANDIPSETVSRFVNAYISVVKLIESRELSLQRAETDTESRQMQQEIQVAALNLIQANGLTLSDYWELLGLANSDPEFRDRVLDQIDEANP